MALTNRIESLRLRHVNLERIIEQEELRPLPDVHEVKRLKLEKLRLKDEIAALMGDRKQDAKHLAEAG